MIVTLPYFLCKSPYCYSDDSSLLLYYIYIENNYNNNHSLHNSLLKTNKTIKHPFPFTTVPYETKGCLLSKSLYITIAAGSIRKKAKKEVFL